MKYIGMLILSICTLGFATAETRELSDARIKGYQMGACDWWTQVNGSTSGWAYGCSNYPRRIVVPDGQDVSDALKQADARIADLERRVTELEKKIGGR